MPSFSDCLLGMSFQYCNTITQACCKLDLMSESLVLGSSLVSIGPECSLGLGEIVKSSLGVWAASHPNLGSMVHPRLALWCMDDSCRY